jgi:uncharacterized protein with HEPN domain
MRRDDAYLDDILQAAKAIRRFLAVPPGSK